MRFNPVMQQTAHSITSSARKRSVGGIVIPIALGQLELGWLLDRQISGLCAAQNFVDEADGRRQHVGATPRRRLR
jgi:hypothetical protein